MRTRKEAREYCRTAFKTHGQDFINPAFTKEVCEEIMILTTSLGPDDAYVLFEFAKSIPDGGTYLEIGSANGGSLLCVQCAAESVGRLIHLIGIDFFVSGTLRRYIKTASNLTFYRLRSDDAVGLIPDHSVDLIFVDGDHSREQVYRDIVNYLPKLKLNGLMIGDDFHEPGIKAAVVGVVGDAWEMPDHTDFFTISADWKENINASSNISGGSG